jgi:hypothetical protein
LRFTAFHRSWQVVLEPSNQALRLKTSIATVILDAKGTLAEATKRAVGSPRKSYICLPIGVSAPGRLGRELLAQKFLCSRRLSIPLSKLLGQETDQALTNRRPVVGYFPDQRWRFVVCIPAVSQRPLTENPVASASGLRRDSGLWQTAVVRPRRSFAIRLEAR